MLHGGNHEKEVEVVEVLGVLFHCPLHAAVRTADSFLALSLFCALWIFSRMREQASW